MIESIKNFLQRSSTWSSEHEMAHVRKLCLEELINGLDAYNSPHALQFAKICRSQEIYNSALKIICRNFDEVFEYSKGFWDLDFGHLMAIITNPELIVQSENRLLEAALKWIERSRCTEVQDDLTLMDQLTLEAIHTKVTLKKLLENFSVLQDEVRVCEEELSQHQILAQESKRSLQISEISARHLQQELMLSTQLFEKSSKALGGMKTEHLFEVYKTPKASTQRLLEAVALLLGKECHWKATQKLCSEGLLAHTMMKIDLHAVPAPVLASAESFLGIPMIRDNGFTSKAAKTMCAWLKSACSCAQLHSSIRSAEHRVAALFAAHQPAAGAEAATAERLASLRTDAKSARAAWMRAEVDLFELELRERLCAERLRRDAIRLERCAHRVFSAIKWPFVDRDRLAARVLADPFVARFLLCSPRNLALIRAETDAPTAAFLHAVGSAEPPIVSAARQGRHYSGSARESLLPRPGCSPSAEAAAAAPQMLATAGLVWRRERVVAELGPCQVGRPAAIGCTARGSLVAVAGRHIYVAGGLDPAGRATARVFRATVEPAARPLAPGDWEQLPFLSTERAFACGGVMLTCLPGRGGTGSSGRGPPARGSQTRDAHAAASGSPPRPQQAAGSPGRGDGQGAGSESAPFAAGLGRFRARECLFVAGGYSAEGRWLRSVEALELPSADHWRRLPGLSVPRAIATAWVVSEVGSGGESEGEGRMIAVGGFDEHSNPVRRCERVDVPMAFDELGSCEVGSAQFLPSL